MKRSAKHLFAALFATTAIHFSFAQVLLEKEYRYSNYAVNNTVEAANTTIETSDGGYLIAGTAELSPRTPFLAKIDANGDSIWTRYYSGDFNGIAKLYRDNDNKLYGIFQPTYGRITFIELDETNGDTLSSFPGPMGVATGQNYMAHTQLPDGDYILSYALSNSPACIVKRFTPGSLTPVWSHDYAGEVIAVTDIIQDGSDIVMSGYCGADWWQFDLAVTKLAASDGTVHWTEKYVRNAVWRDRKVGLAKNSAGDYLVAAGWTHNGHVVPSVLRVAAADGDSLSLSYLDTHAGAGITFGFCDDLTAFGGGFVAAGEIDQEFDDATGNPQNAGQMALICIDDNGQIVNSYAMNQVGVYYNGSIYTGAHAWGLECIATSDNHVLVVGKGNYIAESNGWISAFGDAYMVKVAPQISEIHENGELAGLVVWPNPSSGKVRIAASETIEKIVVCDQPGAIVYETGAAGTAMEIDLTVAPGVYNCMVYGRNGKSFRKLIVH
jgi:hypothetical protein